MPATVQGIEFEIRGSAETAVDSISKLSNALTKLQKLSTGDTGLKRMATEVKEFAKSLSTLKNIKSLSDLSSAVKGITSFANAVSRLSADPDAIGRFASNMSQVAAIDYTNLTAAAAAILDIMSATRSGATNTSGINRVGESASSSAPKVRRLAGAFDLLRSKMKSIAGLSMGGLFNSLKWSASGLLGPVRALGNAVSGLANRFKRLLIMRTFRAIIRAVTQAFKEGINNLYQYSHALGGEFAASMDQCSTSLQYLKNSLGAMVAPIVNSLAPALDFIIDKIVTFLNVLNQLMARLGGASYWTKAKKAATSYGGAVSDAIGGAGGAAKEALKYLAPFDEINKFDSDSSGGVGGGGGGGGSGTDYGEMFEEMVAFNDEIANFADMLTAAWENADFTEVGQLIGEKLTTALENINWESIKATCNRIAQSLATFINGFVETPGLWSALGTTIGEGINTAVGAWNKFFDTTNFDSIGQGVAEALNTVFDPKNDGKGYIKPEELGRALSQKIKAAIDFAFGFLVGSEDSEGFNFRNFGNWLSQVVVGAFENIPFDRLEAIVRAGINGVFATLSGFFDGLGFGKLSTSIDNLQAKFNNFLDTIRPILEDIYNDILQPIINWAMENGVPAALDAIGSALDAVGSAAKSAWKQIKPLWDQVIGPFMNTQMGKVEDALLGLKVLFDGISVFFDNSDGTWLVSPVADLIKQLSDPNIRETISQNMSGIGDAIKDALDNAIDSAKNFGARLWNALVDSLSQTNFGQFLEEQLGRFGFTWEDLKIPVTAEITDVDQSPLPDWKRKIDDTIAKIKGIDPSGVKPKDKDISGFTAELMSMHDSIDSRDKQINNVKALFKTSKDGLSTAYKTINTTSRYSGVIDSLSSSQKTLATNSRWSYTTDALSSNQKTFGTTSKWSYVTDNLSSGQKTFTTTSDFKNVKNSLTEAKVTFEAVAKFAKIADKLSSGQRTFETVAAFTKSVDKLSNDYKTLNCAVKLTKGWSGSVEKALGIETIRTKLTISTPSVKVIWDKFSWGKSSYYYPTGFKVYGRGGIMNAATLMGYDANGTAHIGGEAGQEAILPLDRNTEWMDKIADRLASRLGGNGDVTVQVVLDGKVVAQTTADVWRSQARNGQNPLVGVV